MYLPIPSARNRLISSYSQRAFTRKRRQDKPRRRADPTLYFSSSEQTRSSTPRGVYLRSRILLLLVTYLGGVSRLGLGLRLHDSQFSRMGSNIFPHNSRLTIHLGILRFRVRSCALHVYIAPLFNSHSRAHTTLHYDLSPYSAAWLTRLARASGAMDHRGAARGLSIHYSLPRIRFVG